MLAYADKLVGQIVSQLEQSGVRDNTLILFTGDNGTDQPIVSTLNGIEVKGGKGQMTDAGTRVPLIANWPGDVPEGKVSTDLVDFSDFLPTLCETAGASIPETLSIDGRSFLPQLKGQRGNTRGWIYCWYSRGGKDDIKESARNRQYKLYRTGKFYDVSKDVLEQNALVDLSPEEKQVHTMLQQALDQFKDARPASPSPEKKNKKKG